MLTQLRHDPRTIALLVVVPCVLMTLLKYMFDGDPLVFDRIGAPLLGLFPLIVMFLVTSVATLRERTTGTLERLLTMPLAKLDLLARLRARVRRARAAAGGGRLGLYARSARPATWPGPPGCVFVVAVGDALLGTALGLFVSRVRRDRVPGRAVHARVRPAAVPAVRAVHAARLDAAVLRWISDVLPLSYAVDAMTRLTRDGSLGTSGSVDVAVVLGCTLLALALGAATLRRRTA